MPSAWVQHTHASAGHSPKSVRHIHIIDRHTHASVGHSPVRGYPPRSLALPTEEKLVAPLLINEFIQDDPPFCLNHVISRSMIDPYSRSVFFPLREGPGQTLSHTIYLFINSESQPPRKNVNLLRAVTD